MRKFALLLSVSALAASAATIQFTGLPLNTQFGTFNGFALATLNGTPDQYLICDDFDHTTYVPSGPLGYDVSWLTGDAPLRYARFAGAGSAEQRIALYEQAALLLDGLQHTGPGQLLDLTADYQYALWSLFTPSAPLPTVTARTLLEDAADAVRAGDPRNLDVYARLRILTPEEPFATNQEFLQLLASPPPIHAPGPALGAPAPEPSPFILMSAGIAVLAVGIGGRRLRRAR